MIPTLRPVHPGDDLIAAHLHADRHARRTGTPAAGMVLVTRCGDRTFDYWRYDSWRFADADDALTGALSTVVALSETEDRGGVWTITHEPTGRILARYRDGETCDARGEPVA